MTLSTDTTGLDLYNLSMANVKAAVPAVASSILRADCEASAKALQGRVVVVTGE